MKTKRGFFGSINLEGLSKEEVRARIIKAFPGRVNYIDVAHRTEAEVKEIEEEYKAQ